MRLEEAPGSGAAARKDVALKGECCIKRISLGMYGYRRIEDWDAAAWMESALKAMRKHEN